MRAFRRVSQSTLTHRTGCSFSVGSPRVPGYSLRSFIMPVKENFWFKAAWISLVLTGTAILGFGIIASVWPGASSSQFLRATGVASIGMGLFGVMITLTAYRRRERWAWFTLWYYPIFWMARLLGGLPPNEDHIHQVVLIMLSLAGLLVPMREFFR